MSGVRPATTLVLIATLLVAGCGSDPSRSGPAFSPTPGPTTNPLETATPVEPTPFPSAVPSPTESPGPVAPVALVATQPAILRSDDAGRTWTVALPIADARLTLVDANVGWAWARGDVFETRDGGRTWASHGEALRLASVESIAFADPQRGALLGTYTDADGVPGRRLLFTTDGGTVWTPSMVAPDAEKWLASSSLRALCIDRAGGGFAAGIHRASKLDQAATVLVTRDAGASWVDRSDQVVPSFEWPPDQLACPGEDSLWVVSGGGLFHSGDGGESWELAARPAYPTQYGRAAGVTFIDPQHGWLAATDELDVLIFRTTDGGRTWLEQLRVEHPQPRGAVVDFADRLHGLVGVIAPPDYPQFPLTPMPIPAQLIVTEDGGDTWQSVDLSDRWPPSIRGAVPSIGFESLAWAQKPEPAPTPEAALASALLSARALGVARSDDGGASWHESFSLRQQPGSSDPAPLLRAVFLADRDRGFAVGDGGMILRTDDGGRTWSSQAQNAALPNARNVAYEEVVFLDAQRGIVGGGLDPDVTSFTRSPVLLYTTDGGATWSPATIVGLDSPPAGDSRVPRHACFTRSGRGVAADTVSGTFSSDGTVTTGFEGRFVLITSDAGASWNGIEREMPLPDDFRLWDVACTGDADFWLVGGLQRLPSDVATPYALHSTDGGATWAEVAVPLPGSLTVGRSVSGASFVAPEHGWFAAPPLGDPLVVLRTLDGGDSWQTSLTADGTDFADASVVFADEQNGVVAASRVLGPLNQQPAVFSTRDGGATWSLTDFGRQPTSHGLLDVTLAR